MRPCLRILLVALLTMLPAPALPGQEVLRSSKVVSRANRRFMPAIGLPVRKDGQIDRIVRYREWRWEGADSLRAAAPRWMMLAVHPEGKAVHADGTPADAAHQGSLALPAKLAPFMELCRQWAGESPKGPADVVCGPLKAGWYLAVCKKTRSSLGWKSIAFIVPPEGADPLRSLYDYSRSVNYLETRIGYNLFPRLPGYLQEIIEEMTATELLCPYQEFDPGLEEGPDREVNYDMELDYIERD